MKFQTGMKCYICGCTLTPGTPIQSTSFTRDHVVPKVSGGKNIKPACRQCNILKSSSELTPHLATLLKAIRICTDDFEMALPKSVTLQSKNAYILKFSGFTVTAEFKGKDVKSKLNYTNNSSTITASANLVVNGLMPVVKTLYSGGNVKSCYKSVQSNISQKVALPTMDISEFSLPSVISCSSSSLKDTDKTACRCCGKLLSARVSEGVLLCEPCYELFKQGLNALNSKIQSDK